MAATVVIISAHGATITTTETDITSATIKYRRSDADTNDTSNPIPKPAAGNNFSWRKTMRIKVNVAPDGDISNLRFFSDGVSWGTGVTMRGHTNPVSEYTQASSADEGTEIDQGTGSAITDMDTYTSGSPLTVNSGVVLTATTGYGTQDTVETQLKVASTASRGKKGPITYTYRFDES